MQQKQQIFIKKKKLICAAAYSQLCAVHRNKCLLPVISLYSKRKAAALQQLAAFHAHCLLPVVTIFIIPTVGIPTEICVSQRHALFLSI